MEGLSAALLALALVGPGPGLGPEEPAEQRSRGALQGAVETLPDLQDLLTRLRETPDADLRPVLIEAYDAFREEEGALRLERAELLAVAMHARARAQWSALSLALLSSRMGRADRAEAVLDEQFERSGVHAERVELLERRAIAVMGSGAHDRALDILGHAMVLGGTDAQQMLGRDALARREYGRARPLFGALLPAPGAGRAPYEAGEVPAWALRGWGLALLGARADPVGPPARR